MMDRKIVFTAFCFRFFVTLSNHVPAVAHESSVSPDHLPQKYYAGFLCDRGTGILGHFLYQKCCRCSAHVVTTRRLLHCVYPPSSSHPPFPSPPSWVQRNIKCGLAPHPLPLVPKGILNYTMLSYTKLYRGLYHTLYCTTQFYFRVPYNTLSEI